MENQNQNNPKTVKWNEHDFPNREKPTVGIRFFNINSGETRVCDTEALITAHYNSSNMHANAMVGQDFGWRLAPDTVKRMRDIRDDESQMDRIVTRFRLTEVSEITDPHLLTYMFQEDQKTAAKAEAQQSNDYQRQYEKELRDLDESSDTVDDTPQTEPTPRSASPSSAKPRLNRQQKQLVTKQTADAKRREENIAAGRDINDGIDLSDAEKKALGDENKTLANSDSNSDNNTQS